MSASRLREAAALMRERAEAARAGRWSIATSSLTPDGHLVVAEWEHAPKRVATCSGSLPEGNLLNAEHIASWHPAVALAVADWLDHEAQIADEDAADGYSMGPRYPGLLVANAYLGSDR